MVHFPVSSGSVLRLCPCHSISFSSDPLTALPSKPRAPLKMNEGKSCVQKTAIPQHSPTLLFHVSFPASHVFLSPIKSYSPQNRPEGLDVLFLVLLSTLNKRVLTTTLRKDVQSMQHLKANIRIPTLPKTCPRRKAATKSLVKEFPASLPQEKSHPRPKCSLPRQALDLEVVVAQLCEGGKCTATVHF